MIIAIYKIFTVLYYKQKHLKEQKEIRQKKEARRKKKARQKEDAGRQKESKRKKEVGQQKEAARQKESKRHEEVRRQEEIKQHEKLEQQEETRRQKEARRQEDAKELEEKRKLELEVESLREKIKDKLDEEIKANDILKLKMIKEYITIEEIGPKSYCEEIKLYPNYIQKIKKLKNEVSEGTYYIAKDSPDFEIELTVDFHQMYAAEAEKAMPRIMKICKYYRTQLTIIHGFHKGTVLKDYFTTLSLPDNWESCFQQNEGITVLLSRDDELILNRREREDAVYMSKKKNLEKDYMKFGEIHLDTQKYIEGKKEYTHILNFQENQREYLIEYALKNEQSILRKYSYDDLFIKGIDYMSIFEEELSIAGSRI